MNDSNKNSLLDKDKNFSDKVNWLETINEADIDLRALADIVYDLLKQELRLERQKQGVHR